MKQFSPLVSIIVPVYKVEKYLSRCIESILAQTYQNIEVILIDDGSPDRSGQICDKYACKDSRARVIHQQNHGVSAARNVGIEAAMGQWIAFVDADDFIHPFYLEYLINNCVNTDFVISGDKNFNDEDFHNKNIAQYLRKAQYSNGFLWSKLFNRDVIIRNNINLDEKIRFMEDMLFILDYIVCCQSIRIVEKSYYNYTIEYNIPSEKYKLSSDEIIYIITQYNLRREKLKNTYNQEILPFPSFFIAMYPLTNIIKQSDSAYYLLYKRYFPNYSYYEFYNNNNISPISRIIAATKATFLKGDTKGALIYLDYLAKTYKTTDYKSCKGVNALIWKCIKKEWTKAILIILFVYKYLKNEFQYDTKHLYPHL